MDKLTKRVSKIQSDTQLRFDDLETVTGNTETSTNKKIKILISFFTARFFILLSMSGS